jgi:tRNA modification GTPase
MENRAIVTSVAGTTRDSIEENLTLGGVLFRLVDTAGIRETPDLVEQEGVRRTEEAVRRSDILAVVLDTSQDYTREKALCLAGELLAHQRTLFVHNKVDLLEHHARPKIETVSDVYVSAKTGEGMDVLKAKLIALVSSHSNGDDNGVRITRTRHLTSLEKAREYLKGAVHSVQAGLANEFIALDVRSAVDALAELTGEVTTDDVLNHIFGSFCVGK